MKAARSAASALLAESAQDLFEVEALGALESLPALVRKAGFLETVVIFALLGVGKDVIRLGDLFEFLFGAFVVGIRVGVVLLRERAVDLLDLVGRCAP